MVISLILLTDCTDLRYGLTASQVSVRACAYLGNILAVLKVRNSELSLITWTWCNINLAVF